MDYKIKDSGERSKFESGAVRDLQGGKGRFDLIPPATTRALAIHYEFGCIKYGDRNWEKGIPVSKYLNSAIRHSLMVLDGMTDENHLISAIWNLFCAYETILRTQNGRLPNELNDLPWGYSVPDPYQKEKSPNPILSAHLPQAFSEAGTIHPEKLHSQEGEHKP